MSDKKSFLLYFDIREPLELLSDEERGRLFIAILNYAESGTLPDLNGAVNMAFVFIQKSIDRDASKWNRTCQKRADAGRLGGMAKAENQQIANLANATFAKQSQQNLANLADNVPVPVPVPDNVPVPDPNIFITGDTRGADMPPKKSSRFSPPSFEEVKVYCQERKNGINPQGFIDFYEARGWKLSSGVVMKDWMAAVRTWENRSKRTHGFTYNDKHEEGESL